MMSYVNLIHNRLAKILSRPARQSTRPEKMNMNEAFATFDLAWSGKRPVT